MDAGMRSRLEHIVDEYVPTSDLNELLKGFIAEKAREASVWGAITASLHRMLGGEADKADHRGAVTELMILALDIMDDLQDLDNPDKPWMSCPRAFSLNAILALSMAAVAEAARISVHPEAVRHVAALILRSVNGQQKDLNGTVATEPTYIGMVEEKSGSLMRLAFYMGYSGLDDLDPETIEQLGQLGDCVGTAAQLRNDLGDVRHYDRKNDLLDKKKTLPVLFLLEHADEDFPPFKHYYNGELSRDDFLRLKTECLQFIADSGCVEYSQIIETLFLQRAEELLETIPGQSPWKENFRLLTVGSSTSNESAEE